MVCSTVVFIEIYNLQDPGNLGSILRSAAAAGIKQVFCSVGTTAAWGPKVLRGGMGAHFLLNISEALNLADFVGRMRGQSLALVPSGAATISLFETDLRNPTILLIGNEGAGLSQELVAAASARVTIPMPGKIESLNAAAAGAICLFELVRQRQIAGR